MTKTQAIKHFGSIRALATALGISHVAVINWKQGVPPLRQLEIEQLTAGALRADRKVPRGVAQPGGVAV
jgi:DNA-binding transcriptional regulator YdaS (Cro superfamily)